MTRTSIGGMSTFKKGGDGRFSFLKDEAFWRGVASVFNVTGTFTPKYYGRDPNRADYEALSSDWEAIGQDMEHAIRRFEIEHAKDLRNAGQKRLFDPDAD